jgi:hypothetical protein
MTWSFDLCPNFVAIPFNSSSAVLSVKTFGAVSFLSSSVVVLFQYGIRKKVLDGSLGLAFYAFYS